MKRCPDCAEWIQDDAKICRFCRAQQTPKVQPRRKIDPSQGKIIFWGVIAIILLAGFSRSCSPEPAADQKQETASKSAVREEKAGPKPYQVQIMAERKLKEVLKDSESAELRNVRVPSGAAYACGEVNSRNSFGGYTGYRRFIAGAASAMPVAIEGENMDASEFESSWRTLC